MTLTEAARAIQSGNKKKVVYQGETGRLIGVGPRYADIMLDSEVERWRESGKTASPKYLYVLPEELEFEDGDS